MNAETYAAFNRAVRTAVQHINADKRKYMQYFINHHRADPDVAALTVDDFPVSRLQVVEPSPIPEGRATAHSRLDAELGHARR